MNTTQMDSPTIDNKNLIQKINELENKNRNIALKLAQLSNENKRLTGSMSWKLTSPLRLMGRCYCFIKHVTFTFLLKPSRLKALFADYSKQKKKNGLETAKQDFKNKIIPGIVKIDPYHEWLMSFDNLTDKDKIHIHQHIQKLSYHPKISIVMPVYNTPEVFLRKALDSVLKQLYGNWELCIADDFSTEPHVRTILNEYMQKDPRIKVVFRQANGHIVESSNSALALATGEFVGLLDHDDMLQEHALYMVVEALNRNPHLDLIYSDEDKITEEDYRYYAFFKPDWNPLLFLSVNYINHFGVYRASIINEIGGFQKGFEGAQDYDLMFRFIEKIPETNIYHIPHILYHWRSASGSTAVSIDEKPYVNTAAHNAVWSHVVRMKYKASVISNPHMKILQRVVFDLPETLPKVAIIIPTRDKIDLLKTAIDSILKNSEAYPHFEIIIVNNNSQESETHDYFTKIKVNEKIKVIDFNQTFNWSQLNNFALKATDAELLCFLNNDVEVISPDWLKEMVQCLQYPKTAAVGAKLYFPDETIQHAGIILGLGGMAGHLYKTKPRDENGYFFRLKVSQNYSAVTGACLLVKRSVFEALGGFDEKLAQAFNDIEFCMRLRKAGYLIAWTPFAELYHHESVSRGSDFAPENKERYEREAAYIREKHPDLLSEDPVFNPNLHLYTEDVLLAEIPRALKPWLVE